MDKLLLAQAGNKTAHIAKRRELPELISVSVTLTTPAKWSWQCNYPSRTRISWSSSVAWRHVSCSWARLQIRSRRLRIAAVIATAILAALSPFPIVSLSIDGTRWTSFGLAIRGMLPRSSITYRVPVTASLFEQLMGNALVMRSSHDACNPLMGGGLFFRLTLVPVCRLAFTHSERITRESEKPGHGVHAKDCFGRLIPISPKGATIHQNG
jgi:hypothetical protein